ncbi:hypothetical protein FSARC_11530 [Fusarium sarcochroum]|uniref:JmjC domain-containing protein n=1 Tax=Fusarium sarcochroum TaxID=1208366 RepID=A0A8H4TF39_9HYPO|nr:hypothetical protein FSARC_11530 [Fusarium sarcochroum]
MKYAPRLRKEPVQSTIPPETWVNYLEGSIQGGCPDCGSKAIWRQEHVRRWHGMPTLRLRRSAGAKEQSLVSCLFHETTRYCSQSNLARCRKAAIQKYSEKSVSRVKEETDRLQRSVRVVDRTTRQHADAKAMLRYLTTAAQGKPITKYQYTQKKREKTPHEFIFCSREEAKEILSWGPPTLPIVIPPPPMEGEDYHTKQQGHRVIARRIVTEESVDAYDSRKKALDRIPERITGKEALRRYESDDDPPINMLNIRMTSEEAERDWMAKLPGYNMMEKVIKQAGEENVDLLGFTRSMQVRLQASQGADTLKHVDHNAVTTDIILPIGMKLWIVSSDASEDRLKSFANDEMCSDDTFIILLDEGYELIQPPMTIHSVHTCEKSVTLCFMHLDSRTMLDILKQTLLELKVLEIVMDVWKADLKSGDTKSWPGWDGFSEAKNILELISGEMEDLRKKAGKEKQKKRKAGSPRKRSTGPKRRRT